MKTDMNNTWKWLVISMTCPVLLIAGQNISLFIILFLFFSLSKNQNIFAYRHPIQWVVFVFAIGAIVSTIDVFDAHSSFSSALSVLPNYLYWSIMVWCFISFNNHIPIRHIGKYITIGLLCASIYYIFLRNLSIDGWTASPSQNSFSLLIIAFAAPSIYYINSKRGLTAALIILFIIVGILVLDGRRAGSVLTLFSCLATLFLPRVSSRRLAISLLGLVFLILVFSTQTGESLIESMNPRIHTLIYESEKVTSEDRSYLTRQLMIEKSLLIFDEHPITGVGLNNFKNYEVEFIGNFESSEFIMNKEGVNETSAHNSYINLLAEGGLLLFLPFIALLLFNISKFIVHYNTQPTEINALYWSFTAMTIHLFFITGIVNVFVWFLIAIVTSASTINYNNQPRPPFFIA